MIICQTLMTSYKQLNIWSNSDKNGLIMWQWGIFTETFSFDVFCSFMLDSESKNAIKKYVVDFQFEICSFNSYTQEDMRRWKMFLFCLHHFFLLQFVTNLFPFHLLLYLCLFPCCIIRIHLNLPYLSKKSIYPLHLFFLGLFTSFSSLHLYCRSPRPAPATVRSCFPDSKQDRTPHALALTWSVLWSDERSQFICSWWVSLSPPILFCSSLDLGSRCWLQMGSDSSVSCFQPRPTFCVALPLLLPVWLPGAWSAPSFMLSSLNSPTALWTRMSWRCYPGLSVPSTAAVDGQNVPKHRNTPGVLPSPVTSVCMCS